ncbi:MAG: hypothetical protein IT292_06645 [Deltaproteobacteria bacterium]|nr:hypothetical protein [Deltaproteobacteria bacterium]
MGYRFDECPRCEGNGSDRNGGTCSRCGGDGYVIIIYDDKTEEQANLLFKTLLLDVLVSAQKFTPLAARGSNLIN